MPSDRVTNRSPEASDLFVGLGHDHRHLWLVAQELADPATGALPPTSTLAAAMGLSTGYVRRLLNDVIDAGVIRVVRALAGRAKQCALRVWGRLSTTRAGGRALDALSTLSTLSPGARRKTSPWDRTARMLPRRRPRTMGQTWLDFPARK